MSLSLRFCIMSLTGAVALALPSTAAAHEGWGILIDAAGRIYFTDIPTNTIWRVSRDGRKERVAEGKHSHALHMDAAGNIYGSNPHLTLAVGSVWRLSPNGKVTDVLAPTNDLPLGLQSFIMDAEGSVYSVNARTAKTPVLALLKRSPDGSVTRVAGGAPGHADGAGPAAQFTGIDGMAWGDDGALYVADGPWVRRVSLDGTVTTPIVSPLTDQSWGEDLMGIAADDSGSFVIADYANRRVIRSSSDRSVTIMHGTGLLWAPTGVTVKDGNVYSLQHLRMPLAILGDLQLGPYLRIQRMSRDGTVESVITMWGSRTPWLVLLLVAIAGLIFLIMLLTRRFKARRKVKVEPALRGS
ncbi:MAG TPA: hypothetical protein VM939_05215 [Gemmatimonadaceae bacterium]|nr:hypothetical protein [Gemmatimonadaceae bacterium]